MRNRFLKSPTHHFLTKSLIKCLRNCLKNGVWDTFFRLFQNWSRCILDALPMVLRCQRDPKQCSEAIMERFRWHRKFFRKSISDPQKPFFLTGALYHLENGYILIFCVNKKLWCNCYLEILYVLCFKCCSLCHPPFKIEIFASTST